MRIDIYLAENGFSDSRTKAKTLIAEKRVFINGRLCDKPSENVDEGFSVTVSAAEHTEYVSRGGYKLEAALDEFSIDPKGITAVDIGASSGGFTDCLLKRGAKKVYAVDCGSGQLARCLREDNRVCSLENTNARELTEDSLGEQVELAVMDLSFISQTLVYPALCRVLKKGGVFVSLIKPQFEVGRGGVGKNGIVKEEKARRAAVEKVTENAKLFGLSLRGVITSPIKGGDGNVEYLAVFDYIPNEK